MLNSADLLEEIRFEFLTGYKVAGMAEPYVSKIPQTLEALKKNGIGAVISLTENNFFGVYFIEAGFQHLHAPIDDCEPPTWEAMDTILDFIDKNTAKGIGVVVHCCEGRGRTGTVLGIWLALQKGVDGKQAIEQIYNARVHTVLTYSQRDFIERYLTQKQLNKRQKSFCALRGRKE